MPLSIPAPLHVPPAAPGALRQLRRSKRSLPASTRRVQAAGEAAPRRRTPLSWPWHPCCQPRCEKSGLGVQVADHALRFLEYIGAQKYHARLVPRQTRLRYIMILLESIARRPSIPILPDPNVRWLYKTFKQMKERWSTEETVHCRCSVSQTRGVGSPQDVPDHRGGWVQAAGWVGGWNDLIQRT